MKFLYHFIFKKTFCENKYRVPQRFPGSEDESSIAETFFYFRFQKVIVREQIQGSPKGSPKQRWIYQVTFWKKCSLWVRNRKSVLRIELGFYWNAGNEKSHLPLPRRTKEYQFWSGEPSPVTDTIPGEPGEPKSMKNNFKLYCFYFAFKNEV